MWRDILHFIDVPNSDFPHRAYVREAMRCIQINKAINFTQEYEMIYFLSAKTSRDQIMLDLSRWQEKTFSAVTAVEVYGEFINIVCPIDFKTTVMERKQIVSSIIAHEKVCEDSRSVEGFLKQREK
jgi:hypothetical protein